MTHQAMTGSRRRARWATVLVAAAVGIVILLALHPASGIDRLPPECYSMLGYVVPCGSALAFGVALAGALAAGAAAGVLGRRGRR